MTIRATAAGPAPTANLPTIAVSFALGPVSRETLTASKCALPCPDLTPYLLPSPGTAALSLRARLALSTPRNERLRVYETHFTTSDLSCRVSWSVANPRAEV